MDIYQVSTVNEWWGLTTMYNGSTEVDPLVAIGLGEKYN